MSIMEIKRILNQILPSVVLSIDCKFSEIISLLRTYICTLYTQIIEIVKY